MQCAPLLAPLVAALVPLAAMPPRVDAQAVRAFDEGRFVAVIDTMVPRLMRHLGVPAVEVGILDARRNGFRWHTYRLPPFTGGDTLRYNLGSLSKSITAWAVLRLVESGKIALDDPVNRHLRHWRLSSDSLPVDSVTVRRLLSHTAGINVRSVSGVFAPDSVRSTQAELERVRVAVTARPGTRWAYSGGGYGVLQLLIEEVSGRTFADFVRSEVFVPLGMLHSDVNWTPRAAGTAAPAVDVTGWTTRLENFALPSAAGVNATVGDLALFAAAHLPGPDGASAGRGVLSPTLVREMMRSAPGTEDRYGLGVFVYGHGAQAIAGHDGSNSGWSSEYLVQPSSGDAIVLLAAATNGSGVVSYVAEAWRRLHLGHAMPWPRPQVATGAVLHRLYGRGSRAAMNLVDSLRRANPREQLSEPYLNFLGYDQLRQGRPRLAVRLFDLITRVFPRSANAWDSLADGAIAADSLPLARAAYEKVRQLDPGNKTAITWLEQHPPSRAPRRGPQQPGQGP